MPNHISNKLTLNCDSETATKVFAELSSEGEDGQPMLIDFNKLVQYPKRYADADKVRNDWEKANPKDWSNAPRDGYNQGGYEWCRDNWGTKWNAYSQQRINDNSISFDTAWNTPTLIFEAISAKFPDVAFSVEYADEDIGHNAGILHYHNGKKSETGFSGAAAAKLWFSLNPDSAPKEYGYNPETFESIDEDAA